MDWTVAFRARRNLVEAAKPLVLARLHLLHPDGGILAAAYGHEIADPGVQLAGMDGLAQVCIGPVFEALQPGFQPRLGGDQNDGDLPGGRRFLDLPQQLVAVHAGHHQVGYDQVGQFPFGGVPGFDPVGDGDDVVPGPDQHAPEEDAQIRVVLGQQHPVGSRQRILARRKLGIERRRGLFHPGQIADGDLGQVVLPARRGRPLPSGTDRTEAAGRRRPPVTNGLRLEVAQVRGQLDLKARAAPELAPHGDRPAHQLDVFLDQGQADSRSLVAAGAGTVHLMEALEDQSEDARARCRYPYPPRPG